MTRKQSVNPNFRRVQRVDIGLSAKVQMEGVEIGGNNDTDEEGVTR